MMNSVVKCILHGMLSKWVKTTSEPTYFFVAPPVPLVPRTSAMWLLQFIPKWNSVHGWKRFFALALALRMD